jgi:hypothetical protein
MKIRGGFISNSSSSSFVLALKDKNADLDKLFDEFKAELPKDNPLVPFVELLIEDIISTIRGRAAEKTAEEWLRDYGYDSLESAKEDGWSEAIKIAELYENGYKVYHGTFWDDTGDPAELMLCARSLNFETDDITLIHDGR